MSSKTKAFVIRDFRDAGTETNYTASKAGEPSTFVDIDSGAFANYAAAGLVRAPTKDDATPAADTKPAKAA